LLAGGLHSPYRFENSNFGLSIAVSLLLDGRHSGLQSLGSRVVKAVAAAHYDRSHRGDKRFCAQVLWVKDRRRASHHRTSPMSKAFDRMPWTDDQVEGWKAVVDHVHQQGGRIVAQIWHGGRASAPGLLGDQQPFPPPALTTRCTSEHERVHFIGKTRCNHC
jgi:hypothetical protein